MKKKSKAKFFRMYFICIPNLSIFVAPQHRWWFLILILWLQNFIYKIKYGNQNSKNDYRFVISTFSNGSISNDRPMALIYNNNKTCIKKSNICCHFALKRIHVSLFLEKQIANQLLEQFRLSMKRAVSFCAFALNSVAIMCSR